MVAPLLERSTWALAVTEPTYRAEATPDPTANDATLFSTLEPQPLENETETAARVKGAPGADSDVTTASAARLVGTMEWRYDESAGTPPPFGKYLRACGLAEVIMDVEYTGTAEVTSGLGSLVLPVGAVETANYYTGAVGTITAGTENERVFTIVEYNSTTRSCVIKAHDGQPITLDATSEFSIAPFVQYRPTTLRPDLPNSSLKAWFYFDQVKHFMDGGRGTMGLELATKTIGKMSVDIMGLEEPGIDASTPQPIYTNTAVPQAFNIDNTPVVDVFGTDGLCFKADSFALNNATTHQVNPGCSEYVMITDRQPGGTLTVEMPLLSTVDFYTIAKEQTRGRIAMTHGTEAGKYVTIVRPSCTIQAPTPGAADGIRTIALTYKALPIDNQGKILQDCFFTFS